MMAVNPEYISPETRLSARILRWSTPAHDDATVKKDAATENFGMEVEAGLRAIARQKMGSKPNPEGTNHPIRLHVLGILVRMPLEQPLACGKEGLHQYVF